MVRAGVLLCLSFGAALFGAAENAGGVPVGHFQSTESGFVHHFLTIGTDQSYETSTITDGPLHRAAGVVRMSGRRVLLSPPALGRFSELEYVVWGKQRYLVEPGELTAFCAAAKQLIKNSRAIVQSAGVFGGIENDKKAHPQAAPTACLSEIAKPLPTGSWTPDNNALERTRRGGVPATRAVVRVSPCRSTQCYAGTPPTGRNET